MVDQDLSIASLQKQILEAIEAIELPDKPRDLYEPIKYMIGLGGKRMRPVLTLLATNMFNGSIKKAMPCALAIEVFHNFTLIHDDIMDNAPLRRGRPTVFDKWDSNVAILSGDGMFVKAYQLIAQVPNHNLKEVLDLFNTTALEVCEGQQYDMDFEALSIAEVNIEAYINMIRLKTSVLLAGALKMGAIIGEASPTDADLIYQFGENIGIAFQLQDDLLDTYGDPNKFGKQVGGDILENKKTYLVLKAFEKANEEQKVELELLLNTADSHRDKVKNVIDIFDRLDIKTEVAKVMDEFYSRAMANIAKIDVDMANKAPLIQLASMLKNREQ